jgi:hypothetical protein
MMRNPWFRVPYFAKKTHVEGFLPLPVAALPLELTDVVLSLVGTLSAAWFWFASPFSCTTGFTRVRARKTPNQLSQEL